MDEENKKPDPKTRLDDMEENIKSMKKGIDTISKILAKQLKKEEDEKEEIDKKKEDEEEDEKEVEIEVDKKKEVGSTPVPVKNEGEPKPGQGEVKLPQASAGETDESAKPEGDKGGAEFVAKSVDRLVTQRVNEIMKSMGITKTTTPRTTHQGAELIKSEKKGEFAMDLLKRAKAGTITMADMNRETKDFVKSEYERRISKVLEGGI